MTKDLDGIKVALKFLIKKEMYKDMNYAIIRMKNDHLYTKDQEGEVIANIRDGYNVILEGLA
jgi:hypothetical protein